jgi:hypothetical protein
MKMRCVICATHDTEVVRLGKPGTIEVTAGLVVVHGMHICALCVRAAGAEFARQTQALLQAEQATDGPL